MSFLLGIDEAGRGAVIGPLVIAGILISEENENKLKKLGVKDSKELSPEKREELFDKIKKLSEDFIILKISAKQIDNEMETKSLNEIEIKRIGQIIDSFWLKKPKVFVDAVEANTEKFKNKVLEKLKNKDENIVAENEADNKYVVVGGASILAKVTRDREIEKLHSKYGFFGSLPYQERILIENRKGDRKLEQIGKVVENKEKGNLYTYSIDPNSLKIKKYKITNFIKHTSQPIYEIKLNYGKKVRLTLNHPIFKLNSNLNLMPIKVSDLKVGDYIAAAKYIDIRKGIKNLNLAKIVPSSKKSPVYLSGKIISKIFREEGFKKIQKLSISQGYSRVRSYEWERKSYIPLHIVTSLKRDYLKERFINDAILYSRGRKSSIKAILGLNKEFTWLLGLYLAEGYTKGYNVCISNTDHKVLNEIEYTCKNLNTSYRFDKDGIEINSGILCKLFNKWVGNSAYKKRIPNFIFSCSKEQIKNFIRGYLDGDGYMDENNWEVETRSKYIFYDLSWLYLFLNKPTSSFKQSRGRHVIRELSQNTNSLSPDNIPSIIGKTIKKLRLKYKISQRKLAELTCIDHGITSRIENQKSGSIRKSTIRKIIKIFDGKDTKKINKLLNSDICWYTLKSIKNLRRKEFVYDLEVKPNGKNIENFVGGFSGILLHNSGYPSDERTIEFLEKLDKESYNEIVRLKWVTSKNILENKKQKKLEEF